MEYRAGNRHHISTLLPRIHLPTEATLQLALDDMDRYTNNYNITTTTNYNTTISFNKYAQYQTDEDELSTTSDIAPNTDELEAIYKNISATSAKTSTTIEQTSDTKQKQISLMELLLRYDTTASAPRNDHTQYALPILPPSNDTTELPLNLPRPQPNTTHYSKMPILPPMMETPTRPNDPPPLTWTHHYITTPTTDENYEFEHGTDFHTQQSDIDNNTPDDCEHTISSATTHATTSAITTTTPYKQPKTDRQKKRKTTTKQRRKQTKPITTRKCNKKFTNKLIFVTQNIRGLPLEDDTKLQSLVHQMQQHNWAAVCIQETWRLGDDDFYIDGHRVILKGNSTKTNKMGHIMGGVG